MDYRFSLAYLTVCDIPPPEAVVIAADTGYQMVGFRLLPSAGTGTLPLMTDNALMRETLAAMKDTGVTLADIEIIRIGEHFKASNTRAFLERGKAMGAKNVLVAGDDADEVRLTDNYADFCDIAAEYELTADLEFMPWTEVQNISKAQRIVQAVQKTNSGVLVDALHFDRSESTLEELAALPKELIHYVQLNDASSDWRRENREKTVESLIFTARDERWYPGEGDIPLKDMLRILPKDAVLSLEIPRLTKMEQESPRFRAQRAIETTKALIKSL